jgi:hypothetical protein
MGYAEFKDFYKFSNGAWRPAEGALPADVKGRHGAVAFVIGNNAYVGLGYVAAFGSGQTKRDKEWLNDFYKYDALTGTWTKLPDFPGQKRRDAIAFSINGYGYVGTGRGLGQGGADEMSLQDFYCFDPTTDTWSLMDTPFPGVARYGGLAFVIGGAAHVCLGAENNGVYARDHYKFIPEANGKGTWVKMQGLWDKPKNHQDAFYGRIPRAHAISFIASNNEEEKDYAYIATGDYNQQYTWWYDHKHDLWHEVEDFPAVVGTAVVRQAVGFTIEENGIKRGHFTTGGTSYDANPVSQTWYFIPNVRENRGNDF